MVDLLLRADQINAAPREVKTWLKSVLEQELGLRSDFNAGPAHVLAECTAEEAALVLAEIQSDYVACQVFFELGREPSMGRSSTGSPLHRVSLENVMHHVRLASIEHLAACLDEISGAFANVRHDPGARILAFDNGSNCYVQEVTRQSIKALWESLVMARMGRAAEELGSRADIPAGPTMPVNQAGATA